MTREEVIDIFKCLAYHSHRLRPDEEDIEQAIKSLEQEPKTGRWIEYNKVIAPEPFNSWKQAWKCSECGYGGQDDDDDGWLEWKYCPNCGAKMESEG